MKGTRLLTFSLLCILGTACSNLPVGKEAAGSYITAQKKSARSLQQQDRLADSLALWRSLLPLGSPDAETRQAIKILEETIDQRVDANLRKAEQAYGRGNSRNGDTYMLKVLALSPGNSAALQRLAQTQAKRVRQQQKNKTEKEYKVARGAPTPAPVSDNVTTTVTATTEKRLRAMQKRKDYRGIIALGDSVAITDDSKVNSILREAHVALADQDEQAGRMTSALQHMQTAMALGPMKNDPLVPRSSDLRKRLSNEWHAQGVRLMSSDLDKAIAALQKSVNYNPYNNDAKRKLLQAETLQKNLKKIEAVR